MITCIKKLTVNSFRKNAFLKTVWLKVFLGNKSLFKHGLTSRASPIHILFNISIPAPPPPLNPAWIKK